MKIITAKDAAALICDGATIGTSGFLMSQVAEEVLCEVENRFLAEGHPAQLTLIHASGQGNGKSGAVNRLAHAGLLKRVIAGHYNLAPKMGELICNNEVEAYNFPQGTISQWFRAVAGKRPGMITKVGLGTFVDPRLEGGKISDRAVEDLVEVIRLDGEEYLRYKPFPVDVAVIRGTSADEKGNISCEEEACSGEILALAQAARASGGIVIAQVKRLAKVGSLQAQLVRVPGLIVDYVVVSSAPELYHRQTDSTFYDPSFSGVIYKPLSSISPLPLSARKIIARRCAMELVPESSVNLGIGMPEGIAVVAHEEGIGDFMTLSVEAGAVDGVPAGGADFGASANPTGIFDQPSHFDYYDGGGIDIAFLGLAETDQEGNVNVSKFKGRVAGCGGFINITQNAKKVVFCGTFTAKGLQVDIAGGQISIGKEGQSRKFLQNVEQITFSGQYARSVHQPVLYVTERAVFRLADGGLELVEIAPGIDLEKDILTLMDFRPRISPDLKYMDARIFEAWPMGLREEKRHLFECAI